MSKGTGSKLEIARRAEAILTTGGYTTTGAKSGKHTTGFTFNSTSISGEVRVYWPNVIQVIYVNPTGHEGKPIFASVANALKFVSTGLVEGDFKTANNVATIPSIYGSQNNKRQVPGGKRRQVVKQKVRETAIVLDGTTAEPTVVEVKRPVGRPRKAPPLVEQVKRPVGRPRKAPATPEILTDFVSMSTGAMSTIDGHFVPVKLDYVIHFGKTELHIPKDELPSVLEELALQGVVFP